jgi:two-component system response regulator HydG
MANAAPRILVVDDEIEMANTIADALTDHGYWSLALGSGREAISSLRSDRFDAIITDLRMPDVDGLAVLHESRDLDPSRPVIVMTGYGALQTALEAARYGAYHYITKPFSLALLAHLLETALATCR